MVGAPINIRESEFAPNNGFGQCGTRVMSVENVIPDDRGADQHRGYQDRDVGEYFSSFEKILIHSGPYLTGFFPSCLPRPR